MTLIKLPAVLTDSTKQTLTPPIGLWSMRELSPIRVLDFNVMDLEDVKDDVVGYSLSFPSQESSLPLVRSMTSAKHEIVGGPHGGLLKIEGVQSHYGPGESLLQSGFSFAQSPYPGFTDEEIRPYWEAKKPFGQKTATDRWIPMEFSRGCAHACGFCAMPKFWGKWEGKSLPIVESYLRWLSHIRDIHEVIVLDDNIAFQKDFFLAVLDLFHRYDIQWSAPNGIYAHNLMNKEALAALATSRCLALSLPFETGCERTARLMHLGKKAFEKDQAMWLVKELHDMRIRTTGFFIIGYPGETEDDVKETLAFANSLPLDERYIYFATPYRGTRLYDLCVSNNYIEKNLDSATYKTPVISTPWLSRERLYELWLQDRKDHAK